MEYCLKQNVFKIRHTASSKHCSKFFFYLLFTVPSATQYRLEQNLLHAKENTA